MKLGFSVCNLVKNIFGDYGHVVISKAKITLFIEPDFVILLHNTQIKVHSKV